MSTMYTDEVSSLQPGMELDRFTISAFLGKGGIGEVYEVYDSGASEVSAIKLIPRASEESDDPDFREILLQSLQRIEEPFLMPVLDYGEEELFSWIRTRFIPPHDAFRARTVHDYARRFQNRLPESMVHGILAQTLRGLHALHEAGIGHGNLKPENLLFAPDGSIRVSDAAHVFMIGPCWDDFHLPRDEPLHSATPFDPLPGFSRALPSLLRSFEYFPPEREEGRTAGDPLCDIYAVGMIAYHLLTGRHRPHLAEPASGVVREINPQWDQWILKATRYAREQRFQTAAEMAAALPDPSGKADDVPEDGPLRDLKVFYAPKPRNLEYGPVPDEMSRPGTRNSSSLQLTKKNGSESVPPGPNSSTPGVPFTMPSGQDAGPILQVAHDAMVASSITTDQARQTTPFDPGEIRIPDSRLPYYLLVAGLVALVALAGFGLYSLLSETGGSTPTAAESARPANTGAQREAAPQTLGPVASGTVTLVSRRGEHYIVQVRTKPDSLDNQTLYVTADFYRGLRIGQTITVYPEDLDPEAPPP